ncbi:MAG TPA: tRNA uridine-5-carboxymethylaminomethyl(34) synthesis GTPase MnmE [Candidatus Onthousia excrementipullorum]|uniref:tRNA modification GTPase MnmE n=1 Tax=Candidatus Onthousia excrementipullorum TaxID=2840884 RepID=A0A9D1DVJ4_9FIRM|nr:tRNA uridine-5-carboxymethylaminomethyl(34) synthesis GTPase MnmE [Candidatus Onthousia excrementipullorum]
MSDTIVAISTKLGVGAISIIRVSGDNAISLVNKIFRGKDLTKVESHTINYGFIHDGKEDIDEVLVSVMRAPKTFTREDIVEINCHGGIATTLRILDLLIENGGRRAEAGEFTKRAFLNGRIDLTEAEAVMDLIESKTDNSRKLALSSLEGSLKKYINSFRDKLKHVLANIEVNIDYPEYYDIEEVTRKELKEVITSLEKDLKNLVTKSEERQIIKNGIKTIIIGRPNVGKSSILNRFLKEDKAIVTDIEGTTRDIVEGSIIFDGIELSLIDTAGIRDTDNLAEKIGVEKSLSLIDKANLIIVVLNSSEELTDNDKFILDKVKDKNPIIVLNKNDLPSKIDKSKLDFKHIVSTNTNTLDGIEPLKEEIKSMFKLSEIKEDDYTYLANERQLSLAKQALKSLSQAKVSLDNDEPVDIIEIDLKEVFDILGSITGESYSDELLDELFANFCVGK